MSQFLKTYLFLEFFKNFFLISFLFFPILFASDFLLVDSFDPWISLMKVPFRYGQMLGILSFIASFLSVKKFLFSYPPWLFISLRLKKKDFLFSFFYLASIISFAFYFYIVPFNDFVFPYKQYQSSWAVLVEPQSVRFVFFRKSDLLYDVWNISDFSSNSTAVLSNFSVPISNLSLKDEDFYILWNETKKLSFLKLEEYADYLVKNKFSLDPYIKQKHVYYSRFPLIFAMLLCGFLLAWEGSLWFLIFSFLLSNWIDLLAFFLPLKYCILLLWGNIFFWLSIVLFNFF